MPTIQLQTEYFVKYLSNNPDITGIISATGDILTALISAVKQLHKSITKDFDLIMIDDESAYINHFLENKIPIIQQDGYTIGRNAVNLIYKQIQGEKNSIKDIIVPFKII